MTETPDSNESEHDRKVPPRSVSVVSNTPQQTVATVADPEIQLVPLPRTMEEEDLSVASQDPIISTLFDVSSTNHHHTDKSIDVPQQPTITNESQQVSNIPKQSERPQVVEVEAVDELTNSDDENLSPNKTRKRKHVCSKVKLERSTKKHAATELKFMSFQINWNKISDHLLIKVREMEKYQNGNVNTPVPHSLRFSESEQRSFLNEIVNQLRLIDSYIPASAVENASKQIVDKHPCLVSGDDDNFRTGREFAEFKDRMIARNNYLNRFKGPATVQTRKKKGNSRAGTDKKYWEKKGEECDEEVHSKLLKDEPNDLTDEVLEQSQSFVRYTLDEKVLNSTINELPVLRRRKLLSFHFEKATGVDIGSLRNYFFSKREKIIDYSLTSPKYKHLKETDSDVEVFKFLGSLVGENLDQLIVEKELTYAQTINRLRKLTEDKQPYTMLSLICVGGSWFGRMSADKILFTKIGTRIKDIVLDSPEPALVAIDIEGGQTMYYVFAERARLSEGTTDIITGMEDIMAVHFVHNFLYMESASKFLELIQEYLLKIVTFTGSKSKAVRVGQRQRIVRKVIKALSNHVVAKAGSSGV